MAAIKASAGTPPQQFRGFISKDPNSKFPAERNRYVLYINLGCPWAHRTSIVRSLKGLEDFVKLVECDPHLTEQGWLFTGKNGSAEKDPLYGFSKMSQLYFKADPDYSGRYTVPALWDRKRETIVNNESSEIIRMFYTEFDDLLPPDLREDAHPFGGFYPQQLRKQIDEQNEWVFQTVNTGVYKCGFATSQEAYDSGIGPLFDSLDMLEKRLAQPNHSPYLFGEAITEADIRLYTTLIRFDAAYYTIFQCNRKMIRHDYPRLNQWLCNLYWNGGNILNGHAFHDTVDFDTYRSSYAIARMAKIGGPTDKAITPSGPTPDIFPLDRVMLNGH